MYAVCLRIERSPHASQATETGLIYRARESRDTDDTRIYCSLYGLWRLLGKTEIFDIDIGDFPNFRGFQAISKTSVRDFTIVADPSLNTKQSATMNGDSSSDSGDFSLFCSVSSVKIKELEVLEVESCLETVEPYQIQPVTSDSSAVA